MDALRRYHEEVVGLLRRVGDWILAVERGWKATLLGFGIVLAYSLAPI